MTDCGPTVGVQAFADAPWHNDAKTALICGAERWDYVELSRRVAARAQRLREQGLSAGQVVLVPDAPGPELLVTQLALAREGAALLPIAPTLGTRERSALIRAAGVEWQWQPERAGIVSTGRHRANGIEPPSPLAVMVCTSGSSGTPRAAMITQGGVLSSCTAVNQVLGLGPGDRWLCCLPRSHVGGLAIGYRCALAGAAVLLQHRFDAEQVQAGLERHRVTHLSLVPPMLDRLVALGGSPPAWLRVVLVGGQSLHPSLAERALANGWPLRVTYGMTETFSQVATSPPLRSPPEAGVIGPPLPGVEIDCPKDGAPPGAIRARGPNVMAGYANPQRTCGDGLSADGWLTTSDLGYWTAEGALRIVGRADDALVIGGHNVFPSLIEDKLRRAPGVTAVVVLGLRERVWGHSLATAYTGSISAEDLERWCRAHLASHERPRRFRRYQRLPVLPSGKYDRIQIQRALSG